jgi:hypothetical protein
MRARSVGRRTGRNYPLNLENRGAEPTGTWDERTAWCRHAGSGDRPAADERQKQAAASTAAASQSRPTQGTAQRRYLRSARGGTGRRLTGRVLQPSRSTPASRECWPCLHTGRPSSAAISFSLDRISLGAVSGRRGAAGRHDRGPTREMLAQRRAICCQRVAQDGRIPVRGLRYGVWRYRGADPRHPHGLLTTPQRQVLATSWVRVGEVCLT